MVDCQFCCPISGTGDKILRYVYKEEELNTTASDASVGGLKEPYAQALESVLVTECTGGDLESGAYRLQNVQLDVQAYQLRTQLDQERNQHTLHEEEIVENVEDSGKTRVLILPSTELDGLWESYDNPLSETVAKN